MIKIAFYSHTIDYGGTWRSHERVFDAINRDEFDPYIFYWTGEKNNNRLHILKEKVEPHRLIKFGRSVNKLGVETGHQPEQSNFADIAKNMGIDIIFFTRSGYYEWPFIERIAPLQVANSVFESTDTSPYVDKIIAISNKVKEKSSTKIDDVIYYPIPMESENFHMLDTLHDELNIPLHHTVLGRIGRPAEFDPIALKAFARLQKFRYTFDSTYIIIAPAQRARHYVEDNNIPNVIFIEPTNDDVFIERFYKTIDIFAHYRDGGESFGVAIAQAMMYGKPVVSHYSGFNAQEEIIGNGRFVVNTAEVYALRLAQLMTDKLLYETTSKNAGLRAWKYFEQYHITKKLEARFKEWLNK